MYNVAIVGGIVPLKIMDISLSAIGSMSSRYCRKLLCTMNATSAVYSFLPPSPLKNHVYCFLDSLPFGIILVSCSTSIFQLSVVRQLLLTHHTTTHTQNMYIPQTHITTTLLDTYT